MLSYSEYKKLNESLYGAQVLGLRQPTNLTQQPMGSNSVELEESETAENEEVKAEETEVSKEKEWLGTEISIEDQATTPRNEEAQEEVQAEAQEETQEETQEEVQAEAQEETQEEVQSENDQLGKILSELESLLEDKDASIVEEVKSNISKIKKLLETKERTPEEEAWWTSVNGQLGVSQPGECGHAPSTRIGWGGHEGGCCGT